MKVVKAKQYDIVVVAASLGGIQALQAVLSSLPADFAAPIVIVQHRTATRPNLLVQVLSRSTKLRVEPVKEDEPLEGGTVYVAPPDQHVLVHGGALALSDGRRLHHVLSSACPLFTSAARTYGPGVVAVVLTGSNSDAAEGALAVKDAGGVVLVQNRATSESFGMPAAALAAGAADQTLPLQEIGPELLRLVGVN